MSTDKRRYLVVSSSAETNSDDENDENSVVLRRKDLSPPPPMMEPPPSEPIVVLRQKAPAAPAPSPTDELMLRESSGGSGRPRSKLGKARADRRNTVDCALLNQMVFEPNDSKPRTDKKSLQLLRESERDSKMALAVVPGSAATGAQRNSSFSKRTASVYVEDQRPDGTLLARSKTSTATIPKLIESCNRFMSVKSRPIASRISAPPASFACFKEAPPPLEGRSPRNAFFESFATLIKAGGSVDKGPAKISPEEMVWQTEVKDLIWLELQAWQHDRSLEDEDKFLCTARQGVGELLKEIMNYRFNRSMVRMSISVLSTTSAGDSGISDSSASQPHDAPFCSGCLSMYCRDCQQAQVLALKQIENLLNRLEAAEALYQSTKAMGSHYPLYKSEGFVSRVKAMCLWYNLTRHHRLKLLILGKLLARLQGKSHYWPITEDDSGYSANGSSSNELSSEGGKKTDGESTESTNSEESSTECAVCSPSNQILCPAPSKKTDVALPRPPTLCPFGVDDATTKAKTSSPYRKYIETVLKSHGLGKSLSFLHRLHNVVLRKAHITLERPGDEFEPDLDMLDDDDVPLIEPPMDKDHEDELRRFGAWSKEAIDLALPSYVPAFIFLSLVPLEVIHEFLKMRLETKAVHPNPLSLGQLMKELREGLSLAMIHRERYKKHITTALVDAERKEFDKHLAILGDFNETARKVFELYLGYVELWVLEATPEAQRKSALDDEWRFIKLLSPMIPGQHVTAARHFCRIIEALLERIGAELVDRISDLDKQAEAVEETDNDSPTSIKWQLLTICRETQQMFTVEREKTCKVVAFAKSLCRDIEKPEYHREHDEEMTAENLQCSEVIDAIKQLKAATLKFRDRLVSTIKLVQSRCDLAKLAEMDDIDRSSVLSRTREILHQGYKFGFEYHRDLHRLGETKVLSCRCTDTERQLAVMTVDFAQLWMKFVHDLCERGRGVRPRWAALGLDFLITAADPANTAHLDEKAFEQLRFEMDACVKHVIGEPERMKRRPGSRRSSPLPPRSRRSSAAASPHVTPGSKSYLSQLSVRTDSSGFSSLPGSPDQTDKAGSRRGDGSSPDVFAIGVPKIGEPLSSEVRQHRMRDAVNKLDNYLDMRLRDRNLIGAVRDVYDGDKVSLRARRVNFSWHRGIKIGAGRFGKVYTAVNNSTGELMAMKEIQIQPGETRAIRRVAEELKIFEGIQHKHLVRYYGVEIHREELLIFMELCSEGTLESLIELHNGLYEGLTRRYTTQLLLAVQELHRNGVVHRDIKPANIFLTEEGNCLKLGDFGSAVKIQAHTTMPGELRGFVGTQAYMAPEVFCRTDAEGHGRATDIWSVGCCVIEMASGKRPWHQFDSSFQIMFKVGMGEKPEIPETLSEEGIEFVNLCLDHDPKKRASATELLFHNFCKVSDDKDAKDRKYELNMEHQVRRSFRKKP